MSTTAYYYYLYVYQETYIIFPPHMQYLAYAGSTQWIIFSPISGQESPIPPGIFRSFCTAGSSGINGTCMNCAAGYYGVNGTCISCAAGKYSNVTNSLFCSSCDVGFYSTSSSTSCTACAPGKYSNSNQTSCVSCSAGTYSNSSSCITCAPGTYSNTNRSACVSCSAGTFTNAAGQSSCIPCVSSYSPSNGSTSCFPCPHSYMIAPPGKLSCSIFIFLHNFNLGASDVSNCFNPISNLLFSIMCAIVTPIVLVVYFFKSRFHFVSFVRCQKVTYKASEMILIFTLFLGTLTLNIIITTITTIQEEKLSIKRSIRKRSFCARFLMNLFTLFALPLAFVFLVFVYFCITIGSILFTSLILFKSLSTSLQQLDSTFDEHITNWIDDITNLIKIPWLGTGFNWLLTLVSKVFGYLSNLARHIPLGAVSVQCQGAQAPIEAFGNVIILVTVFIVIESEYTLFVYRMQRYVTNILMMFFHGNKCHRNICHYIYLFITVIVYYVLSLDPIRVLIQYFLTSISLQQFFTYQYGVHQYDAFCNDIQHIPNADTFMAFMGTTITSVTIIPFIYIMTRIMMPYKLDTTKRNDVGRIPSDQTEYHPLVACCKKRELTDKTKKTRSVTDSDKDDLQKLEERIEKVVLVLDKLILRVFTLAGSILAYLLRLFQPLALDVLCIKAVIRYSSAVIMLLLDKSGKEMFTVWIKDHLNSPSICSTTDSKKSNCFEHNCSCCCCRRIQFPESDFRAMIDFGIDNDENFCNFELDEQASKRLNYFDLSIKEMSEITSRINISNILSLLWSFALDIILWSCTLSAYIIVHDNRTTSLYIFYCILGVAIIADISLVFLMHETGILLLFSYHLIIF